MVERQEAVQQQAASQQGATGQEPAEQQPTEQVPKFGHSFCPLLPSSCVPPLAFSSLPPSSANLE